MDIIQVLPDSIANQIAAGEVIQRPASVVKELVENSIDAHADNISVIIKDAGKTLIQVTDNGVGMSETDARLAFERHATSKIKNANDLFNLSTMGFRGEALASIVAIAEVEVKTKKKDTDLGTSILIKGSEFISQEPCACPTGTNTMVRNLFYNVPARRKFLKKDATELKNIIDVIYRIALTYPDIKFNVVHNDNNILSLNQTSLKQRVVNIFGKNINNNLLSISSDTPLAKITGFIGRPETARKRQGEQYFFVNGRYMKHPYFHKAICTAYENLLVQGQIPSYFIYFEVNPENIDVNIHPTKTEIKFEDEQALWQILKVAVRNSLGKTNAMPTIDFDTTDRLDIPVAPATINSEPKQRQSATISFDTTYNPFDEPAAQNEFKQSNDNNWEDLFNSFEAPQADQEPEQLSLELPTEENLHDMDDDTDEDRFFQFKNKYIVTSVKSGMMFIHQQRAHERILFEDYIQLEQNHHSASQKSMFPEVVELSLSDSVLFDEMQTEMKSMGFEINKIDNTIYEIESTPARFENLNTSEFVDTVLNTYKTTADDLQLNHNEKLALSMAKASSIKIGQKLSKPEMNSLFNKLFASTNPNYSPDGGIIIAMIENNEIDKRF